jgi:hypothetical protein
MAHVPRGLVCYGRRASPRRLRPATTLRSALMTDGGIVSPPDPAVACPIDHEREHGAVPTSAPPKQRRWSTAVGGNRPYVVSATHTGTRPALGRTIRPRSPSPLPLTRNGAVTAHVHALTRGKQLPGPPAMGGEAGGPCRTFRYHGQQPPVRPPQLGHLVDRQPDQPARPSTARTGPIGSSGIPGSDRSGVYGLGGPDPTAPAG